MNNFGQNTFCFPSIYKMSQKTWWWRDFNFKRFVLFIDFFYAVKHFAPTVSLYSKHWQKISYCALNTHLWLFSKRKFNLKSDRVNLAAPASHIECLLFCPMSGRYSTNWDLKGWPGSEIQMYYGCPCKCLMAVQSWFLGLIVKTCTVNVQRTLIIQIVFSMFKKLTLH